MSKVDDLLHELCPDGVTYRLLVDVADILYGYPCDASKFNEEKNGMPLIRIRNVLNGQTETFTTEKVPDDYIIKKGDLLVGMDGNFHVGNWKMEDSILCQRVCKIYSKNENELVSNRYLSHLLGPIMKAIENSKQSGTVKHLLAKDINAITIPVPPLEIQCEIVHILDSFTELTSELITELDARKKQYEYYLNELIKENERVPLVKLGEIATIIRGGNFQKKDFLENGCPCIHYGQMYTHFGIYADEVIKFLPKEVYDKSKKAAPGDIIMAVTSENVEDVCSCTAWLGDEDIAVSGHTAIIQHKQNPKYMSYYFHSQHFFTQKKRLAHGTKVIEVTPSALNDIVVPLPSIEEQERIVSIMDKFNILCTSVSDGIPAEIEARKKQYEYYRDKLLAFDN